MNTATPNTNFTGTGGVCPIGNRCPVGSVNPDPCPAGTYNDMTGQADCLICPEGYYCLSGADSFSTNTCPFGKHVNTGTRETSSLKFGAIYCYHNTFYQLGNFSNNSFVKFSPQNIIHL